MTWAATSSRPVIVQVGRQSSNIVKAGSLKLIGKTAIQSGQATVRVSSGKRQAPRRPGIVKAGSLKLIGKSMKQP